MGNNEKISISKQTTNGHTSEFIELTHNKDDSTISISKVEEVNDDKNPQGHMENINVPVNMVKALLMQIKENN
tara:strand:+ start:1591 stop:1809 length:219 start_codon:yes stop_codon:yes gene_type:complete